MKALLVIVFATLSLSTQAQQKVFEPTGFSTWPNIHPDSLIAYNQYYQEYMSIVGLLELNGYEVDSLSTEQREAMDRTEAHAMRERPYNPGPIGCSWYCAPSFDTTYATSELRSKDTIGYEAWKAQDFDISTAWVEGVKGNGSGAELNVEMSVGDSHDLSSVEIYNGYCKDVTTWKNYNRVKELEMFVNRESIGILQLADNYLGQHFSIGSFYSVNNKLTLKFKIKSVYKSDKYNSTAISDIVFNGKYAH